MVQSIGIYSKVMSIQQVELFDGIPVPEGFLSFNFEEQAETMNRAVQAFYQRGNTLPFEDMPEFPKSKLEIKDWIGNEPQIFRTQRLVEVATFDAEYAPRISTEITARLAANIGNIQEYSVNFEALIAILDHPKISTQFQYCVEAIENALKESPQRDSVLMSLSENQEAERVGFERFFKHMMEKPEASKRSFMRYLELLDLRDNAARLLSNKTLLMIGGGIAPIKRQMDEFGIENCIVTNIEPLLNETHADNSDFPIPQNFYDIPVAEIGIHDEVWAANNSLPTYAFNPCQVDIFYSNSLQAVKQGGFLRVLPFHGFMDSMTRAMRLNRIPTNNRSREIIESLKSAPHLFKVEEYQTEVMRSMITSGRMKGVNIQVLGNQEEIYAFLCEHKLIN